VRLEVEVAVNEVFFKVQTGLSLFERAQLNSTQLNSTTNMFANTIRRTVARLQATTIRKASHATAPMRDGVYRPKSTKEVWTGDAGAYPIIFGIGWCLFFSAGFSAYYFFSSPDVRVVGQSRDRLFRGELDEYKR
jgi:hypothetical protein